MPVCFYMDVHVPQAVSDQLRRRGVDVLTAIEDQARRLEDVALLERARELGRVVFTQDIRFKVLAEQWQREGRPFAGLVFAHQLRLTLGQLVAELELIAKASEPNEWSGAIVHLPM